MLTCGITNLAFEGRYSINIEVVLFLILVDDSDNTEPDEPLMTVGDSDIEPDEPLMTVGDSDIEPDEQLLNTGILSSKIKYIIVLRH